MHQKFTDKLIKQLKKEYDKVDKIDPLSKSFKHMQDLLDSLSDHNLRSLANANIKFISPLARNRLKEDRMLDDLDVLEEEELVEKPLTPAQRIKKAQTLRRFRKRLTRRKAIRAKRMADTGTLAKRARRAAIRDVKKKLSGGKSTTQQSAGERANVERKLAKRKSLVDRLTRKLRPEVRRKERERLKRRGQKKNESFMGEESENIKRVREKHKREKERLSDRRDRELDRARTQDATQKNRATESLEKKAVESGISIDILEKVYIRGLYEHMELELTDMTNEQYAFARVNSFVSGGKAREIDSDLMEEHGAGEMGTDELRKNYANNVPGQSTDIKTVSERHDLVNKIKMIAKNKIYPKTYHNALNVYKKAVAKSSGRKTTEAIAASVARSHNLSPKEFVDYIKKQEG